MLTLPRPDLHVLVPEQNPPGGRADQAGDGGGDGLVGVPGTPGRPGGVADGGGGQPGAVGGRLEEIGFAHGDRDRETLLAAIRSPELRPMLRALGVEMPVKRAPGQKRSAGKSAGNAPGGVGGDAGVLVEISETSAEDLDDILNAALDEAGVGSAPPVPPATAAPELSYSTRRSAQPPASPSRSRPWSSLTVP